MPSSPTPSQTPTPLETLHHWAHHRPHKPFLLESLDEAEQLTYLETYLLGVELIPRRLRELSHSARASASEGWARDPSTVGMKDETANPNADSDEKKKKKTQTPTPAIMLISPNNTLLVLTLFALWSTGTKVILVGARSEGRLWPGMMEFGSSGSGFGSGGGDTAGEDAEEDAKERTGEREKGERRRKGLILTTRSMKSKVEEAFRTPEAEEMGYGFSSDSRSENGVEVICLEDLIPEEYRGRSPMVLAGQNSAGGGGDSPRISDFARGCKNWVRARYPGLDSFSPSALASASTSTSSSSDRDEHSHSNSNTHSHSHSNSHSLSITESDSSNVNACDLATGTTGTGTGTGTGSSSPVIIPSEPSSLQEQEQEEGPSQDVLPSGSIPIPIPSASASAIPITLNPVNIARNAPATTLFTSSAVSTSTLKCVTYTHEMLGVMSGRNVELIFGEEGLPSVNGDVVKEKEKDGVVKTIMGEDGWWKEEEEGKVHLGVLPLTHCFEFCCVFCSIVLATGGSYIFFDRSVSSPTLPMSAPFAEAYLQAMEYYSPSPKSTAGGPGITSFACVPAILSGIVDLLSPLASTTTSPNSRLALLQSLHSLIVGGAPLPAPLFTFLKSQNINCFDTCGATELVGAMSIRKATDEREYMEGARMMRGYCGWVVVDAEGDEVGELVVTGNYIPRQYDNIISPSFSYDPDTGASTYRTGDIYSFKKELKPTIVLRSEMEDANFILPKYDPSAPLLRGITYLGRADDMIILSDGYNVNALAIESTLDAEFSIVRSAILTKWDGNGLMALIQPSTSSSASSNARAAVTKVNQTLPPNKRIVAENVYLVKALPVTAKATLHRKSLKHVLFGVSSKEGVYERLGGSAEDEMATKGSEVVSPSPPTTVPVVTKAKKRDTSVLADVAKILAEVLDVPESTFMDYELDLSTQALTSLTTVKLAKLLEERFKMTLTAAELYGMKTIGDICDAVDAANITPHVSGNTKMPTSIDSSKSITPQSSSSSLPPDALLVTGISCRLPGHTSSLSDMWDALSTPSLFFRSSNIQNRPSSRWVSTPSAPDSKIYPSNWLEDLDLSPAATESFAAFFRLSPNVVKGMSPNARIVLLLGYEAIQDAGIRPKDLKGKEWGVFTAVNNSGWREKRSGESTPEEYSKEVTGFADDAIGSRLSYFLDLTGPAMDLKTACSSAAVAIHQACKAISTGDCEGAIVIASTTQFHPSWALFRAQANICSPTGRCRPFSAYSNGYVASEGAIAIVIQKAESAIVPGHCRIRGSAVAQDGRSHGFYAPNPRAQVRLIKKALKNADCDPDEVAYIEAHGTGTHLGDNIELQTYKEVFGKRTGSSLPVGSAKAVFGHTEECAGLVGLLKAILCLKCLQAPAQPSLGLPHPALAEAPILHVPQAPIPLEPRSGTGSLICGISSFGLSGTLAHIIIEETPQPHPMTDEAEGNHTFVVSARSKEDFLVNVRNYLRLFQDSDLQKLDLGAVCRTTVLGRDHLAIRKAWNVDSWGALVQCLQESIMVFPKLIELTRRRPRIGIWFGMVDRAINMTPRHGDEIASLSSGFVWPKRYEILKRQLLVAEYLAHVGCDISITGGEGIGELAAAVFSGVLPTASAFGSGVSQEDEEGIEYAVIQCDQKVLWDILPYWREDELKILGMLGQDTFLVRGLPRAISSFDSLPSIKLVRRNINIIQGTIALNSPTLLSAPRIPIISAHLTSTISDDLCTHLSYWQNVANRSFRSDVALDTMQSHCDTIIPLGMYSTAAPRPNVLQSSTLSELIADLFSAGCSIDWNRVTKKGELERLPPYKLSNPLI